METGEGRAADQIAAAGALHREEVGGQAVAEGDGAGLIQDHGIHVAAGLHGLQHLRRPAHQNDLHPMVPVGVQRAPDDFQRRVVSAHCIDNNFCYFFHTVTSQHY